MPESDQVKVSDETARTAEQLARERDRLKLLLDINNAVVSHLALDELLHAISESLQKVVPHEKVRCVRVFIHELRFASLVALYRRPSRG